MVPPKNPNFTGRRELLEQLGERLGVGTTAVLPAALHGMGGIGKTQMAVEYIYRHLQDYDIVWWIQATRATQIRRSLTELAQHLRLPGSDEAITAVPAVRAALRLGGPYRRWLLVFDSAESPELVRPFFPVDEPRQILVTSRNPGWSGIARPLEVAVFQREESKELLGRRRSGIADEESDLIADRLGDLPLAIEQAAAWLAETGMLAREYLRLFDEKRDEVLDNSAPGDYEVPVAAAWNVSFDELSSRSPSAHQLLQVCAFFAPEPISRSLFAGVRGVSVAPELDSALRDPMRLGRAIRDINRYGPGKIDHRSYTLLLHRLVQLVLRNRMSEQHRLEMRHGAHLLLANLDPNDPASPQRWPRYQEILPHIYDAELTECSDPWGRQLVVNLFASLCHWGDHQGALALAERAVNAWAADRDERRARGEEPLEDPPLLELGASERLAFFYWKAGEYDKAAEVAEETLNAQLTYALILEARGDFAEARRQNEESAGRGSRGCRRLPGFWSMPTSPLADSRISRPTKGRTWTVAPQAGSTLPAAHVAPAGRAREKYDLRRRLDPPQPRTIVAVDIAGSTLRTNTDKALQRRAMYEFVEMALTEAGIDDQAREKFIDRGDGVLVLIRPVSHAPKTLVLDTVLPLLSSQLTTFAIDEPAHAFQLRSVLHAGEVHFDDHGCYGEAVDLACRLLDAPGTKRELAMADVPLVLVTSELIYNSVVRHHYSGIDPAAFRQTVRTQVAGHAHKGWIWHVPPLAEPPTRSTAPH